MSPDEDFVTMVPLNKDKTRVISKEEVDEIQQQTGRHLPEDEDAVDGEDVDDSEDEEDEDDKGGFLNPKMEKAVTIMGIVAAIVIAIIVIYLVGSFMGLFHFGGFKKDKENNQVSEEQVEKVEMIDIIGMDFDDAKNKLEDMGLQLVQERTEESEKYEAGQIMEQDVKDGDMVETGTTVKVVVCASAEEINVPDVTGESADAAEAELKRIGEFKVNREYEYDSEVATGRVIRQTPKGGTKLAKGETVTIYVSQGNETVKVPNLLGKTESQAKQALKDAGLEVGSVTQESSTEYAKGQVMHQSTASGKYLEKGDTVDIVVSKGADTYELKNYTVEAEDLPEDVTIVSVSVNLKSSSGKSLLDKPLSQDLTPGTTSITVNFNGIQGAESGVLEVTWKDSEGDTYTQKLNVTFTKAN